MQLNLDEAVLAHIKGRPNLQQSFIIDNKYLCGYGDDAKFKLSPDFGKHALDILSCFNMMSHIFRA